MASKVKHPITRTNKDDFVSVAKRLGCDESKTAFEKKLGKIAKAAPKSSPSRRANKEKQSKD
jgi:hypothetical protein